MFPPISSPSPLRTKIVPVNKRTGQLDMGEELSGYGLQGVKVTEDELRDLIAELGLGNEDAGDLAKGLSDISITRKSKPAAKVEDEVAKPSKADETVQSKETSEKAEDQPKDRVEATESKAENETSEAANSEAVEKVEDTKEGA